MSSWGMFILGIQEIKGCTHPEDVLRDQIWIVVTPKLKMEKGN